MHKLLRNTTSKKFSFAFQITSENIGCSTVTTWDFLCLPLLQLKTFNRTTLDQMDHWSDSHICLQYCFWIHYHRIQKPHIF